MSLPSGERSSAAHAVVQAARACRGERSSVAHAVVQAARACRGERSSAAHAVVQAARACRQVEQCHFSHTCSEFSRQITNYFASFLIIIRLQKISQNALVSKNEGPGKHPRCLPREQHKTERSTNILTADHEITINCRW